MTLINAFLNLIIRTGTKMLCRIDGEGFDLVPTKGPLIIAINHITSLEVPLLYAHLQPRKMIGLAKIETWDNIFMGWLFDLWESIPIRRGEADMEAIRACLDVLKDGKILGIAPEGTRTKDGCLIRGQPGIALLALRADVAILPLAHWGAESFTKNLKKLKRTEFSIRAGRMFRLDPRGEKVSADVRQAMTDEIMCQIASLMPEKYHGVYQGKVGQPPRYLDFL